MLMIECHGGMNERAYDADVMYPLLATHYKNPPPVLVERATEADDIRTDNQRKRRSDTDR